MRKYDQIAGFNRQRIEAISDGVFAIALTLLILDIKVPVSEIIHSEKDLMDAFASLTPKLLSYFLSFMTLGIYWSAQSSQFHYISKSDRHLNWINLFFLLFVSVIPFTTAFLSEFITYKFAIFIYWLNLFLLGVMLAINWKYAKKNQFLSLNDSELKLVSTAIKRRIIEAQTLYSIGAALCFLNTYVSIGMFIIIQLHYALAISFSRNKSKKINASE
jgi:uncharacterized membrane protein